MKIRILTLLGGFLWFTPVSLVNSAQLCLEADDHSRVTAAGGSITEIIYFLKSDEKLVAVDVTSNYPMEAKELPSIGYVRALSAEGILSLNPSVIIGEDDMGPIEVIDQIKKSGVPIVAIAENHSIEGIIEKVRCVATIIGKSEYADEILRENVYPKISELRAHTSKKSRVSRKKVLFILGMQSGSPLVAGKAVSADGFISMIGGENSMNDFEGWKPVSTEAIIKASPDIILISNRGLAAVGDKKDLRNHPALKLTPAARNNEIYAMDGMEMLGFGPRTINAALELSKKIN